MADPTQPAGKTDAWHGSYVYFGKYRGYPVKYRVLEKQSADFGETAIFLDCDNVLWKDKDPSSRFDSDSYIWADSYIRQYLNSEGSYSSSGFFADSFTKTEQASIASSEAEAHDPRFYKVNLFETYVALSGEHIFLLDGEDISNKKYGYYPVYSCKCREKTVIGTEKTADWWLRTYDCTDDRECTVGYIGSSGEIGGADCGIDGGDYGIGVSPALNVKLSSVLFSSVVSGTAGQPGAEYKLTLKAAGLEIAQNGNIIRAGDEVIIPYAVSGADSGDVTQVSVLILDREYQAGKANDANIKYYGKLETTGQDGEGSFTLPAELSDQSWGEDYHVYILAEDVNGEKETDYASEPADVRELHNVTVNHETGDGPYKAGDTVTIEADAAESGQRFKGWRINKGEIHLDNENDSTTMFVMPKEDVEVTAVYENIVDEIIISAAMPQGGKDFSSPVSDTAGVNIAEAHWKDPLGESTDGKAKFNTKYTLHVTVKPEDGYYFTEDTDITLDGKGMPAMKNIILNTDGSLTGTAEFTTAKAKLKDIAAPEDIAGVANGAENTAESLGLPGKIAITTEDVTVKEADVVWNLIFLITIPSTDKRAHIFCSLRVFLEI